MSVRYEVREGDKSFKFDGTHALVDRMCRLTTMIEHIDATRGGPVHFSLTTNTAPVVREILAAEWDRCAAQMRMLAAIENAEPTDSTGSAGTMGHHAWTVGAVPQTTSGDVAPLRAVVKTPQSEPTPIANGASPRARGTRGAKKKSRR